MHLKLVILPLLTYDRKKLNSLIEICFKRKIQSKIIRILLFKISKISRLHLIRIANET